MAVALGFYLFGHLADLMTTIGFFRVGCRSATHPGPGVGDGGLVGLIALKVLALATA